MLIFSNPHLANLKLTIPLYNKKDFTLLVFILAYVINFIYIPIYMYYPTHKSIYMYL